MSKWKQQEQIDFLVHQLDLRDLDYPPNSKRFSDAWELMWRDLVSKTADFDKGVRIQLLLSGLHRRLLAEKLISQEHFETLDKTYSALGGVSIDIMVFTVLEVEWSACLGAFSIFEEIEGVSDFPFGKLRVFTIPSNYASTINVGVTLIGRAHNTDCMAYCQKVFEVTRPKSSLLCGICAVRDPELDIGDVVCATQVWEIDRGKKLSDRDLPTFDPKSLTEQAKSDISTFRECNIEPTEIDVGQLETLVSSYRHTSGVPSKRNFSFRKGIVCSGDYVRRDGLLKELASRINDELLSIEMEGAGFASTCESFDLDWYIFRGGSDFGDRNKSDNEQPAAAFNASLVTRMFIADVLVPRLAKLATSKQIIF